jgi:hypothetical protein
MLASRPPRKPAKYTGLRVTGQYGIDRRPVETVLADDLALEFHDRYPRVETFFPVCVAVDVPDFDVQAATHERQQTLQEDVTEVTATPTVHVEGRPHGFTVPARRVATHSA